MSKVKQLSPAMQAMVRVLEIHGNIDPVRDLGRRSGGGKFTSATILALMDRGILREAGSRSGHVHFPATTPEQVWAAAHEEDDAREAERVAHDDDPEQWLTTVDEDGEEMHVRDLRTGGTISAVRHHGLYRHWGIYYPGQVISMSAAGSAAEARLAADRYERDQAHTEALAEHAQWEINQAVANQATPRYRTFTSAVRAGGSYRAGLDILHAEALAELLAHVLRQQHIAQSGVAHVRNDCPALAVGGCMKCTAPATVYAAQGGAANTPAEARTGISDRAAAALADVANLRQLFGGFPVGAGARRALDRIEQALRGQA
jgi:hypothetical protein